MVLLGSTGSIGVNTLAVAERFNIRVEVLVAGNNIALLKEQIVKFQPCFVSVATKELAEQIDHPRVFWGEEGIVKAIRNSSSSIVVNALVGFLGLRPTIVAIEEGKTVALANKESLVAAGAFIDPKHLRPIDSEHFGLWYLLNGRIPKKMTITASGGAFRDWPIEKIEHATLENALKHPNWSMGAKITIDSATMTNKLFELLEARWLYGCENVDAIIEPKSVIHALVEFADGATTAQMAHPDMKLPIAYALMQEVNVPVLEPVDLLRVGSLEFREIIPDRYPIWAIKEDLLKHPKRGVVVNAANEAAITKFVEGRIAFGDLPRLTIAAYEHFSGVDPQSIDEVFEIDREVRRWCETR
ncbi:1-deoxy-D-xylulose-5-phosphate reductoisomerase [Hydrogenimonas cancrithermarum]|uniref:1-deoxy-D-xylulose 5-phosphate reductoisomerase n=1 Tax=Hydrogenimonas cancrithermarum TaxID=2993563 RepID=A0ABM8FL02_9BACT|nr:1-deoxy-D-xylulose-5-phosphate reductoisomerase [Hydrogenimonas cancrithermarum]BDY12874.1 1-deoxy-D-xylulose 5-phosphate reductoisomerase [Hydrogenimonas cancrithermarum]BDY12991.1 1-deoxy-D-xylulose 5-phosphate reductoisomerase [Hydrogenimonas cancrithermarum]